MTDVPVVSIITLTYNHAALLPQCIESVLAQSFPSWEQIVIDDESIDDTMEVLARYSDPRLRVIRQKHQGAEQLPQTYQKALAKCRGRFIGFLDGDDYWSSEHLATLLPAFDDPHVVLSFGSSQLFGDLSAEHPERLPTPDFYRRFPRGALFNTPVGATTRVVLDPMALTFLHFVSVLIRRSALDRIGGLVTHPGLRVMDYPTLLCLTLEGRFHHVDRIVGYWRVHGRSVFRSHREDIYFAMSRFIRHFRRTHAARLDLSPAEWRELDRRWDEHHIRAGKLALGDKRWKDARAHFLRLARKGAGRELRAIALAGLAVSLVHRELSSRLEWIFKKRVSRLLGRT